ncbi:unnamed protein product [Symbiodinium sp. CCMP2592]|nr:unnamed protein product [Symbiodinium sp. CCMP2592]
MSFKPSQLQRQKWRGLAQLAFQFYSISSFQLCLFPLHFAFGVSADCWRCHRSPNQRFLTDSCFIRSDSRLRLGVAIAVHQPSAAPPELVKWHACPAMQISFPHVPKKRGCRETEVFHAADSTRRSDFAKADRGQPYSLLQQVLGKATLPVQQ